MKKLTAILTSCFLLLSNFLVAQEDYYDEEDARDFERYAHLNLSSFEIGSIVVGVVLLLVARSMDEKYGTLQVILYIIGGLASLPLVLVILSVAQKVISYAFILALIVGALYYLFGRKS